MDGGQLRRGGRLAKQPSLLNICCILNIYYHIVIISSERILDEIHGAIYFLNIVCFVIVININRRTFVSSGGSYYLPPVPGPRVNCVQ